MTFDRPPEQGTEVPSTDAEPVHRNSLTSFVSSYPLLTWPCTSTFVVSPGPEIHVQYFHTADYQPEDM